MPRRMITSEIFFNEKVGSLPAGGRLLFIGIFSNADDDGRLKASPKFLKARIFPYDDDISSDDVQSWRDQCRDIGLIRVYNKDGKEYLDVPGWLEHQSIRKDRYKESTIPAYGNQSSPTEQPLGEHSETKEQPDGNQVATTGLRSIGEGRLGEVSLEREIPKVSLVAPSTTPGTKNPPKTTRQKPKQAEAGTFLDLVEQHIGTKLVQRPKHIGQIRPLLVKFPEATPESLLDCFKWLKQHDPYCQARDSPLVISMLPSKYPEWVAGKLSAGGQPRGSPKLPTADELKSRTRKFMKGEP